MCLHQLASRGQSSFQSQDPRESSEGRARLGEAGRPPVLPSIPQQVQGPPSKASLTQPGCVPALAPEYTWGQEVAPAVNSRIDSGNDRGPTHKRNLFIQAEMLHVCNV